MLAAIALPVLLAVAPLPLQGAAAQASLQALPATAAQGQRPADSGGAGSQSGSTHSANSSRVTVFGNGSALEESFARFESLLDGTVGMSIAPVAGSRVLSYGTWTTGDAWSTLKVPIAIAASRNDTADEDDLSAAIALSDNDAARRLWNGLAGAEEPVTVVQALLSEAGDSTDLIAQLDQQGDDAFGNLNWSLAEQAEFTAALPCLPGAGAVLSEMRSLDEDHRWGLAAIGGTAKGGWGPDDDGHYLVRQLGILNTPPGQTAVTLAAQPNSGEFEDGAEMLTAMAQWLEARRFDLPSGRCAPVTQ